MLDNVGLDELRVECFMLCDGVQEAGGKLYVLGGGWDTLFGKEFPVTHLAMALAIRLAVPWNQANRQHHFRVELVDEDGRDILPRPLDGQFNVGRPSTAEPGDELPMFLPINLIQITFPRPGKYVFRLLIDGEERAKTKVRVRRAG